MSENEAYFILLVKKPGKKRDRSLVSSFKSGSSKVELLPGTLLVLVDTLSKGTKFSLLLETLELSESVETQCIPGEVEKISTKYLELLYAIPTCQDRLAVYQDKQWLKEALDLQVKENVLVKPKGEQAQRPGVLRYKGKVPNSRGIFFGVELTEHPGLGSSDGVFRKERLFSCPPDSAVFCPVHRIRKMHSGQDLSFTDTYQLGASEIPSQDLPGCSLRLHDRVVWMSDLGAEEGTVKWIGILPDDRSKETTVGVEFDNPVGSGTGKYKEHRLFYAKQNHASLVPILGLIKAEEMYNTNSVYDDNHINEVRLEPEYDSRRTKLQHIQRPDEFGNKDISLTKRNMCMGEIDGDTITKTVADVGDGADVKMNNLDFYLPEDLKFKQTSKMLSDGEPGMNPLYNLYKGGDDALEAQAMDEKPVKVEDVSVRVMGSSNAVSKDMLPPPPDPDLGVDSMVEVLDNPPLYGVIRWIGAFPDNPSKKIAGLEMEEETSAGTDGTFKGERFFKCGPKRAFFLPLYKCKKDKRFHLSRRKSTENPNFGLIETPDIQGNITPLSSEDAGPKLYGKNRGIQGHHNSCYLDATLFAMFSFTTVFDTILYRPRNENDLEAYDDVQRVMKEGIVNPLRSSFYVRADKVMNLRRLLDKLGKIPGMMVDEKDPEEFLSSLMGQIMKAEPLLHLSSGEKTNFYQLFMEKDDQLLLPTTQKLVEMSFHQSCVKLKEVPSCLIIQMPRFGKDFKMFKRIVPSLELDITDILEEGLRECYICGQLATTECRDCYQVHSPMLSAIAFCEKCSETSHKHVSRRNHKPTTLKIPPKVMERFSSDSKVDMSMYREKMELFAIVCIQTSHYVSFVKCGSGKDVPWVFFDSMADRMGEQKGYNIPEVKPVPELCEWLDEGKLPKILKIEDDKLLPEDIRRLLCDAYMCMYQNPEIAMFR